MDKKSPERITVSVDWEVMNGYRMKFACVTKGTEGVPDPFGPSFYIHEDAVEIMIDEAVAEALKENDRLREIVNILSDREAGEIDRKFALQDFQSILRGDKKQCLRKLYAVFSDMIGIILSQGIEVFLPYTSVSVVMKRKRPMRDGEEWYDGDKRSFRNGTAKKTQRRK